MMYERPDLPIAVPGFNIGTETWSQYAEPVVAAPEGSDLVEDWYPYWAVAKRLGLKMQFSGVELDFGINQPPTTEEMLEIRARNGRVTPSSTLSSGPLRQRGRSGRPSTRSFPDP